MNNFIPEIGSFVKVLFKNGYSDSGFVYSWSNDDAVLRNEDGTTVTAFKTEDIFLIKALLDKKEKVVSDVYVEKEIEPRKTHVKHVDRAKDLAELHKLRAEEERRRAREKMTTFNHSGVTGINYDNNSILRDKSVLRNTSEKNR